MIKTAGRNTGHKAMGLMDEYRQGINDIDQKMAALFEQRMQISRKIGAYKMKHGLAVKDPGREAAIFERGRALVEDQTLVPYYADFQKQVISLSCDIQERMMEGMKVAYSGVEGAFAYIAARKMFPESKLESHKDFYDAYESVVKGEADCVVLPIENSYAGDVGAVMDLAFSGNLFINRVMNLPISHNLIAVKGADISKIRTVVSHGQALAQCREYLHEHGYETREYSNTARAAQYVKELNDPTVAALASEETAELFGLTILERDVNTAKNNTTRFAVFTPVRNLPVTSRSDANAFSVFFTVSDEAGALAMVLDIIGSHGYNIMSLRSRPMASLAWNYYFFAEIEGDVNCENGRNLLNELSVVTKSMKLAGAYVNQ